MHWDGVRVSVRSFPFTFVFLATCGCITPLTGVLLVVNLCIREINVTKRLRSVGRQAVSRPAVTLWPAGCRPRAHPGHAVTKPRTTLTTTTMVETMTTTTTTTMAATEAAAERWWWWRWGGGADIRIVVITAATTAGAVPHRKARLPCLLERGAS